MKIINKVPHSLTIIDAAGVKVEFPKSTDPIRVEILQIADTYAINGREFGTIFETVTPKAMVKLQLALDKVLVGNENYVIVSRLAHENVPYYYEHFSRVLSPGQLIRDSNKGGEVIGARGFTIRRKLS